MFLEIFRFECRQQIRSPLFWSVCLVFFLMAFLVMASESASIGGIGNNLDLNAPFAIITTHYAFSLIAMFAAVAFVATSITRDFDSKMAEIVFSTGVARTPFFFGRFAAGFSFAFLAACSAILGTLIATFMPWLDAERVAPLTWAPYWHSVWAVTLPNMFITGALFFSVAAITRSMFSAYGAALALIVFYSVVAANTDPETIAVTALLDPFGVVGFSEITRYWTVFDKNSLIPEIAGSLLKSRVIWLSLALVVLGAAAFAFRFSLVKRSALRVMTRAGTRAEQRRRKTPANESASPGPRHLRHLRHIGAPAQPRFGRRGTLAQFVSQFHMEIRGIVRSIPFYVLLVFAMLNVLGSFIFSLAQIYGTPILPVTRAMLLVIGGSYIFMVYLIIIYYSGELVHRERQTRMSEIVDASPYPGGVMVTAKIGALWFIIVALLSVVGLTAMVVQVFNDYYFFELAVYGGGLFVNFGWGIFLLCVLAVFVQVLSPNKWMGMLIVLGLLVGFATLSSFGFEHSLYRFGAPPGPLSDMNGFGHFLERLVTVGAYWSAFAVLLTVGAHMAFQRGSESRFRFRWRAARQRFNENVRTVAVLALAAWIGLGGWIFYNTNVLNAYETQDDLEELAAEYEKRYKRHDGVAQPDAVAIDLEVDIYPDLRRIESRGTMLIVNPHRVPIEVLHLQVPRALRINALVVSGEVAEGDLAFGFHRITLTDPLQPGQTMKLAFDFSWINDGFENRRSTTRVVENGTFVNNTEITPGIGYSRGVQLTDNNTRRKYGLGPVERMPKFHAVQRRGRNQLGVARRTSFKAVVSTSLDQIAIAPGRLMREWKEEGRRYFEYEMDAAIWPFVSFQSARYEVARDVWNGVELAVFFHPDHPYNVNAMFTAAKKSLDYFTREFSPYPYNEFRILEFPAYASFAQSFPNTIPFSEAIGFVADLRDDKDIDYVFYVTAHEMAHQWWAHQVIGAEMQGATLIVETLAQYSALMVMEAEYGKQMMRRFLKYELDRYLAGRGGEQIEELPLNLVEGQGYIHYHKGSLVMYALKEAIGEAAVNRGLKRFIAKYGFTEAPFPTSADLIAEFRAEAGPEQQKLITDLFEKITLYDLRVADVEVVRVDADRYRVDVVVEGKQFHADGEGREVEVPMDVYVDVAVFPEASAELGANDLPVPLAIERRRVKTGTQTFSFTVNEKPDRVGVDPYHTMVDRNPDDNLKDS